MTTIAYRDGVMAGDSRAYGGGNELRGSKVKVVRLPDGTLVGVSSPVLGMARLVRDWVSAGMREAPITPDADKKGFDALVVTPDGQAVFVDGNWLKSDAVTGSFFAIGSGSQYAIGAMAAGKNAKEAVEIAAELDVWSSGPVYTVQHTSTE